MRVKHLDTERGGAPAGDTGGRGVAGCMRSILIPEGGASVSRYRREGFVPQTKCWYTGGGGTLATEAARGEARLNQRYRKGRGMRAANNRPQIPEGEGEGAGEDRPTFCCCACMRPHKPRARHTHFPPASALT
eukprot:scaffold12777_cov74-Isochrysis_galbana.AAC.1